MYGMINDAIKSMVRDSFGDEVWTEVLIKSGAPLEFEKMGRYDDAMTFRMVNAISETSGVEVERLLESFGRYWISYASKTPYGPMIRMFGSSFKCCLANLDQMHNKMGSLLEGMTPPEFNCSELVEGEFIVIYRSQRKGLSAMVKGLIEGLAVYYGVKVSVTRLYLEGHIQRPPEIGEEAHFRIKFL